MSEPPGQKVFLDGVQIGHTPIWLKQVEAGPHTLRIGRALTDISVESNKTTRISFFQGAFITSVEKQESKEKRVGEEEGKPLKTHPKATTPSTGEETEDLTPWERFLNRSSPNF
jgi:hypothetical protein